MTEFEKKTIKIITAICKNLGCNSCPINRLDKCRVLDADDITCEDSVRMFYEEDEASTDGTEERE